MKKITFLVLLLTTFLKFYSFAQISIEGGQIAPDFPTFAGTLLVIECRDFKDDVLNRMTNKRFEKFCIGEFEMITDDDLMSKQYSDKKKYRFTVQLRNKRFLDKGGSISSDHYGSATDLTKFIMVDRMNDKKFETRTYTNWVTAMNHYPKALEEIRKK